MRRSISDEASVLVGEPGPHGILRLPAAATWVASVLAAILLSACGGGSSDSGGGSQPGNDTTNTGAPPSASGNPFAGTYNGLGTMTLSASGVPPQTISGSIQFVIDARGNVTSDPATSVSGTGKLKGNSFTVTVPGARLNQPGLSCGGALLINGRISGTTITGTFAAGNLSCNGVAIQVTGSFSATRSAASSISRAPAGIPAMSALRKAARAVR